MFKVVITDYILNPDIERSVFGQDVEIVCLNEETEINYSDDIENADGILVWHGKISAETLKRLKKCKIIVKYGTGYDNVDVNACEEFGIVFCNTPDYGVEEVADSACSFILNFVRQLSYYDSQAKSIVNGWQLHSNLSIRRTSDHKLGIIGFGRMGTAVATRMKSFGMKIAFYDPYVPSGYEKAIGIMRFDTLQELCSFSSIITVHTPLTSETENMIDSSFIECLNDETVLINTARGKIIENLDVIYDGLLSGKLSFVGLDVLPQEPPRQNERLLNAWKDSKNPLAHRIIINPHSAYYSEKAWFEMRYKSAQNIDNVFRGGSPKNRLS